LPNLRRLLREEVKESSGVEIQASEKNIFCFDNLAALTHGIKFTEKEQQDFAQSWSASVETSTKLITYILKLPAHNVQDTVSLSQARKVILELAKPIAEVARNIQLNIKTLEDKQSELNSTISTLKDLDDKLYIEQTDLDSEPLGFPRTVCTSSKCIDVINFNGNSRQYYKTHCHENCSLKGIATDVINNPALQKCSAMKNGYCKKCGCSWNKHMHITYELIPVKKIIIDENINKIKMSKMSDKERITAFNQELKSKITNLREAERGIIKISTKFAAFTKANAILHFNDDFESFLNLNIKEEETKQHVSQENSPVLKNLLTMKEKYMIEKKIFFDAFAKADSNLSIAASDIKKLENELYAMESIGESLKRIILEVRRGKNQVYRSHENQHQIKITNPST
jgi:hypothetical protein